MPDLRDARRWLDLLEEELANMKAAPKRPAWRLR
jgi:hypothetical protein